MPDVDLIGVPLDLGGGRRGVDMGPSAVRIAGIADRLAALGHRVTDRGDITTPTPETRAAGDPKKRYVDDIRGVCEALYATASDSLGRGAFPIVIGGDHSLAAGSVAATALHARRRQRPIGLLWIDAHADMNTPATTLSGNVHGMPLAALLGENPRELALIGGEEPKVRPEHTVLVGIRNLDEREKDEVRAAGVHIFTMKDIDRRGAAASWKRRSRWPVTTRQASTCRSTSTSAIPRLPPAWALRSGAASTTARRTWRWNCSPTHGCSHSTWSKSIQCSTSRT
jgi:arginase